MDWPIPEWARTRRAIIGLGCGLLALTGLSLWFLWLPSVVRDRLEERCSRLGLKANASSVLVGLSGVSLSDLRVGPPNEKPWFTAESVSIGMWPWRAGDGLRAIDRVQVVGARVSIDLSKPAFAETLERVRAERSASDPQRRPNTREDSSEERHIPEMELEFEDLALLDAAGALVSARGVQAAVSDDAFAIRASGVQLGSAPADVVSASGVELQGKLANGRPLITRSKVSSAVFEWAFAGIEAPPERDTFARVFALRSLLSEKRAGPAAKSEAPAPRLWTDDARFDLDKVRVFSVAEGKKDELLTNLSASLSAVGPRSIRAQGKGKQPDGGNLSWNLVVVPEERRVEGQVTLGAVSLALFAPALPPLPFHELEHARVSASLELNDSGRGAVAVRGNADLSGVAFFSPGLAKSVVGPFSLSLDGEGTWTPARRELAIARGRAQLSDLGVNLSGVLAWPSDGYRVDLNAALDEASCQAVLVSVPAGLLDELASIELAGKFAAKVLVHVDSADLDATKVDFDIDDSCKFTELPPLLDLMRFQQPFIHRVLEPNDAVFEMETGPGTPGWTPIELVSPFMVQAVVAHEDGSFFSHHGFAEAQIGVALARNLKAHAFRFGASTITMQLVKNVFLHRDKLLSRKVQEALITWWLEQHWDKRHILELYLNVIEYGPSLYGVRNAAWHYFGTIPMNLTPAQSAFLATILPNPKAFHEHYEKGQLSASMKERVARFLKHMRARDRIDDAALAFGLRELDAFTFYDPTKPPPLPPVMEGSAQPPPFDMAGGVLGWDELDLPPLGESPSEDGSYGP